MNFAVEGLIVRQVSSHELARLLGYPPGHSLSEEASALVTEALDWYAGNGRPRVVAAEHRLEAIRDDRVLLDGITFQSGALADRFRKAEAASLVAVQITAGTEVDEEVSARWRRERPDAGYFLDRLAAAVVEHLTRWMQARLCLEKEAEGLSVTSHYSPGYRGWDIDQQSVLYPLTSTGPTTVMLLDSGMLFPKHSMLAVYGVGPNAVESTSPCRTCDFTPCDFRRYAHAS